MSNLSLVYVNFLLHLLIARNAISSLHGTLFQTQPHPEPEKGELVKALQFQYENESHDAECSVLGIYSTVSRNGILTPNRWKEFPIYIGPEYNPTERQNIQTVANRLSQVIPCVKFYIIERNDSPLLYNKTYVHITKEGNGCSSFVGKMHKRGAQIIGLSTDCVHNEGRIMHQMIHTLGFHHEENRPDRDDYVKINWSNVKPGRQPGFYKYKYDEVTSFDVPYNTKSIMHSGSYVFSANRKPTIVTKEGNEIPRLYKFQDTDITKLQRMYQC